MTVSIQHFDPKAGLHIRWLVVLTMAGAEWSAYCNLLRGGIDAYLPFYLGSSRRGRWDFGRVMPIFPGYLFVGLTESQSSQAVLDTTGVRELIRDGKGQFVQMLDAEMALCRSRCREHYESEVPRLNKVNRITPGDMIAVPSGPFQGLPMRVVSIDKSGRTELVLGDLRVTARLAANVEVLA